MAHVKTASGRCAQSIKKPQTPEGLLNIVIFVQPKHFYGEKCFLKILSFGRQRTMIKHLFKLIWKKKRSNFLMMLEIFVSFLILFAIWTLSVYNFRNYNTPSGIKSDNVWAIFYNFNTDSDSLTALYQDLVKQRLRGFAEIESMAFTNANIPYSFSNANWVFNYNKKEVLSDVMSVEPDYQKVLDIKLKEGRWFTDADKANKNQPVVITQKMREELFGNEAALGKIIGDSEKKYQVVGVVEHFKFDSDFQSSTKCVFRPSEKWNQSMIVRVKEGVGADFEAQFTKASISLGKNWTVEVQQMENMKRTKNQMTWVPILILLIVCGFLVFNVALGLFGVLFQTISRRKQEIGVRRALGATQGHILWHFIGEIAVIATFGVALGMFLAVQFPLLNIFDLAAGTYLTAMVLAVVSVYLLVIICAFYPSRQASVLQPAQVLHEE
jgi:putative ABC transport system permease protein